MSRDIGARLTVGVVLVPQGKVFAMISGQPAVFGHYDTLVPQFVDAVLGTSRQLAEAPVVMDSLLEPSGLGALAISTIDQYVAMAILLALFMEPHTWG